MRQAHAALRLSLNARTSITFTAPSCAGAILAAMIDLIQMASFGLLGLGGAALGAAAGGGLAGALKWRGGRMAGATGGVAALGLAGGLGFGWAGADGTAAARAPAEPPGVSVVWNLDVIRKSYPKDYARIIAILQDPARRGAGPSELRAAAEIPYVQLLIRQAPLANRQITLLMVRAEAHETLAAVRDRRRCTALANPGLQSVDPEALETQGEIAEDKALGGRLLEQTAEHPVPPTDLDDGVAILQRLHVRALARLSAHDQAVLGPVEMTEATRLTPGQAQAFCHLAFETSMDMLRLPPDQQVLAYKAAAVATARLHGLDRS